MRLVSAARSSRHPGVSPMRPVAASGSLAPNVADALVGDRRVNDGVGDRAVAHKVLKRSCIDATGGKSVASSVPQHVSMDRERQLSGHHCLNDFGLTTATEITVASGPYLVLLRRLAKLATCLVAAHWKQWRVYFTDVQSNVAGSFAGPKLNNA